MKNDIMKSQSVQSGGESVPHLFDDWFDPIEAGLRERVRGFIETMLETELEAVLARPRYGRQPAVGSDETTGVAGHRHGSRIRSPLAKISTVRAVSRTSTSSFAKRQGTL